MKHPLEEYGWEYVKEYDAYFIQRGDTNWRPFICVDGLKNENGCVAVFQVDDGSGYDFRADDWQYIVSLVRTGRIYKFVSCRITRDTK